MKFITRIYEANTKAMQYGGRLYNFRCWAETWLNRAKYRKMHLYDNPCDSGCNCGMVFCSICEPMTSCIVTDWPLYISLIEAYGHEKWDPVDKEFKFVDDVTDGGV